MLVALLKAIKIKGSRRNLAKAIGVTPEVLNAWLNRGINIPLEYAFEIERATEGEVSWRDLVPHLAHFEKRWSGFVSNQYFFMQTVYVAISRIKHNCEIQALNPTIQSLVDDIESRGLQRPIGIDSNNNLFFGEKRLQAYLILGKKTIPAWRISLSDLLNNKYSKETLCNTFLISERISIGMELEKILGNRRGRNNPENFSDYKGKETREIVAKCVGFNNFKTFEQAKRVKLSSIPELIQSMDDYRLSISTAAALIKLPAEHLKQILTWIPKHITTFVTQMRRKNQFNFSNENFSLEKEKK